MKWQLIPPGIVAKSGDYFIHITGFEVQTFVCTYEPANEKPMRIGKFNDKEQAKACCEKHFKEQGQ